jgi:hypothetical protein
MPDQPDLPTVATAAPLLPARPGRYRNERLNELAALKDGWDSYGAPALFRTALRTADALTFVPTGQGGIQIELHAGGVEVEITVTTTGKVEEINVRNV